MNGVHCKGIIFFWSSWVQKMWKPLTPFKFHFLVQIMLKVQINTCIQIFFMFVNNEPLTLIHN